MSFGRRRRRRLRARVRGRRRARRARPTATRSRGSAAWRATSSCAACAGPSAPAAASAESTASASAATRGATPDWERIELARTVAAWTGDGAGAALTAVRPAGARHHADEAVWAALWEPEGAARASTTARLSTTYDGDGRTRRAGLELWPARRRRRRLGPPRRGRGALRLLARPRRAAPGLRVLPLAPRGPRRRRPLRRRCAAPRDPGAVVSDFGGVLTSPLFTGFARIQDDVGRAARGVRPGDGAATEAAGGENPLYRLERGEITEQAFLATLERELGRILGREVTLHGFGERYFGALEPNDELFAYYRGLHERGVRLAMLTNNVREWEPRWRAMLPIDEIFETVVDSGFVGMRKPDPRIYELTLERLGLPPRRARSSTTSSSTSTPRASSASTACTSATPSRRRGARRAARVRDARATRAPRGSTGARTPSSALSCRSPAGPSSRARGTPPRAPRSARARATAARSRAPAPPRRRR